MIFTSQGVGQVHHAWSGDFSPHAFACRLPFAPPPHPAASLAESWVWFGRAFKLHLCAALVKRGKGTESHLLWRGGRAMSHQDREARWDAPDAAEPRWPRAMPRSCCGCAGPSGHSLTLRRGHISLADCHESHRDSLDIHRASRRIGNRVCCRVEWPCNPKPRLRSQYPLAGGKGRATRS